MAMNGWVSQALKLCIMLEAFLFYMLHPKIYVDSGASYVRQFLKTD